jgi:hypothetical protein
MTPAASASPARLFLDLLSMSRLPDDGRHHTEENYVEIGNQAGRWRLSGVTVAGTAAAPLP